MRDAIGQVLHVGQVVVGVADTYASGVELGEIIALEGPEAVVRVDTQEWSYRPDNLVVVGTMADVKARREES